MKTSIMIVVTLALAATVGCSQSNRGGGVSKDEGFKIAVPALDTQLKQGETQDVTVSVHRGDTFKRDVKLQIKASTGISVEPTYVRVNAGDKPDVQLRVSAAKDAAIGEYRIYVTGTPATGAPTSVDFKVKVVAP
jgi:uncharacterized membrane protein